MLALQLLLQENADLRRRAIADASWWLSCSPAGTHVDPPRFLENPRRGNSGPGSLLNLVFSGIVAKT